MRIAPALAVFAITASLVLSGCTTGSADDEARPAPNDSAVPNDSGGASSDDTNGGSAQGASIAEVMAGFPAHFPLPQDEPVAAERTNYQWRIDYVFADDAEPVERAEQFGPDGYQAVDVADDVARDAGPDARTWAWENDEFRVDLALVANGGEYAFRYVVLWK